MGWKQRILGGTAVAAAATMLVAGGAIAANDFGQKVQDDLGSKSNQLFGFNKPVDASSTTSASPAAATLDPTLLVTAAKGLTVKTVAQVPLAPNLDQMAFFPNDTSPTHVIGCNEQGTTQSGVVAIDLKDPTKSFAIIKSGLTSCDLLRRTAWGTILAGEENGTAGRLFEIADPLHTKDVDVTAQSTGSPNIVERTAVTGGLSYEGAALYSSGLMYYADENRPGGGNPGGSYFKFIPTHPWDGTIQPTTTATLSQSPLAAGKVYGLRVGIRGSGDFGEGTETGLGAWVTVCNGTAACGNLRAAAASNFLTAYYRPEDMEKDLFALDAGQVKWCANNTGNEASGGNSGHTWGNTVCLSDGSLSDALTNAAKPDMQFLLLGNSELAMPDNIAQQPGTGNWVIHEDGDIADTHKNNDLWICLPDGADFDTLTDGCLRMATLNDLIANGTEGAEWTGGFWDPTGSTFYVSVQHNMTGQGTLLAFTGFGKGKH